MTTVAQGPGWKTLLGDSVRLLREMPSESVDFVLSDPPYSSGGQYRGDRMGSTNEKYVGTEVALRRPDFAGDNRDQRSYIAWCHLWMSECLRVLRPGAVLCAFTDWRQLPATTDAIQAAGFVWRGIVVWDKKEGVRPQKGRFRAQAEYVVWGSRGPMGSDGPVAPGVFRVARGPEDKLHVAGKPVSLLRDLLAIAPAGGVVLDPFMGSGSTGLAALGTGRSFIGCELDASIYQLGTARLAGAHAPAPELIPAQAGLFSPASEVES